MAEGFPGARSSARWRRLVHRQVKNADSLSTRGEEGLVRSMAASGIPPQHCPHELPIGLRIGQFGKFSITPGSTTIRRQSLQLCLSACVRGRAATHAGHLQQS